MNKKRVKAWVKRTLAFLLTAVMVFTTVDSTGGSVYATSGSEEAVVVETEENAVVENDEKEGVVVEIGEVENTIVEASVYDEISVMAEEPEGTYVGEEYTTEDGGQTYRHLAIDAAELGKNTVTIEDITSIIHCLRQWNFMCVFCRSYKSVWLRF